MYSNVILEWTLSGYVVVLFSLAWVERFEIGDLGPAVFDSKLRAQKRDSVCVVGGLSLTFGPEGRLPY